MELKWTYYVAITNPNKRSVALAVENAISENRFPPKTRCLDIGTHLSRNLSWWAASWFVRIVLEIELQSCKAQKIYIQFKTNPVLHWKPRRRKTKSWRGKRWNPTLNCSNEVEYRLAIKVAPFSCWQGWLSPGKNSLKATKVATTATFHK